MSSNGKILEFSLDVAFFKKFCCSPFPSPPSPVTKIYARGAGSFSLSERFSSAVYFVTLLFLRLVHAPSINAKLAPEHFAQHSSVCT